MCSLILLWCRWPEVPMYRTSLSWSGSSSQFWHLIWYTRCLYLQSSSGSLLQIWLKTQPLLALNFTEPESPAVIGSPAIFTILVLPPSAHRSSPRALLTAVSRPLLGVPSTLRVFSTSSSRTRYSGTCPEIQISSLQSGL